jgi:formylmethanofuran dehydrogenase subunit E
MGLSLIPLSQHLEEAEAFHGHLCGGIVLGVRMALRGLREIGIEDPKGADRKKLMIFVEVDRCATDAITSVTGCRPGKRTMKIKDFGKMAATFVNLETDQAVRISARPRERPPLSETTPEASARLLCAVADGDLFRIQRGRVPLTAGDRPGLPVRCVTCVRCGEEVLDMRDVPVEGGPLCRPCAQGESYFIPDAGAERG